MADKHVSGGFNGRCRQQRIPTVENAGIFGRVKSLGLLLPGVVLLLGISVSATAQTGTGGSNATPPVLPFPTQIRKTVVFITTTCLHQPTSAELKAMTPDVLSNLAPSAASEWRRELAKNLTPEAFAKMTPEEKSQLRIDSYSGTGFLVTMPDERLPKDQAFWYLVTNRHVVQPGVEKLKPGTNERDTCDVLQTTILLNHRGSSGDAPVHAQTGYIPPDKWEYPKDDAVDIAITPVVIPASDWDIEGIPTNEFVTHDMIARHEIVEGDPVIFTGLFVQYLGITKLEPIVRSGSIAMLPDDLITTTLNRLGHIYFAEAHSFGGNSGSPMFVDINRFKNALGYDYRLLGVVTGEVPESSTFSLQVETTYNTTITSNSNISVVVPADEIMAVLESPELKALRDQNFAKK